MTERPAVIYMLAGVTAVGKSKISIQWAAKNSCEIVSCDSVAVYKGMDVGSAKPSIRDRQQVVHHGIDLVDVRDVFSVADYQAYATKVVEQIKGRKVSVLVAGGSGFYLQSFLTPVVDDIVVTREIREEVEQIYANDHLVGIVARLKELNPDGVGTLDTLNPRRVMRGLERCMASGKTILQLKDEFAAKPKAFPKFDKKVLWLDRENEDLENRISNRTEGMLKEGIVAETEGLLRAGIEGNAPASNAVGYRECIAFLKGKLQEDQLLGEINKSTRQLVSKQRKWFRKYLGKEARVILEQDLELDDLNQLKWVRHS
jgi:tRNA dimethylallyltransferase